MSLGAYHDIIKESDFWGQHQELFPDRTNLLCHISIQENLEAKSITSLAVLQPMGYGSRDYNQQKLTQLPDRKMTEKETTIFWETTDHVQAFTGKVLLYQITEQYPRITADWTFDSRSRFLIVEPNRQGPLKMLELFAGGTGGWGVAMRHLQEHASIPSQIVAVDTDLEVLQYYAASHDTILITAQEKIIRDILTTKKHVAIHAHVYDEELIQPISQWAPDFATLSPPCQPFSGAGSEQGLNSVQENSSSAHRASGRLS